METATLTITRYETNGNCIHSNITYKHQNTTYTIQGIERKKFEIPIGEYNGDFNHSPKFNTELYSIDVPNRQGIRLHWGNTIKDTTGCIIVGIYRKENTIYNSKYALNTLHAISKGKNLKFIINEKSHRENPRKSISEIFRNLVKWIRKNATNRY